MDYQIKDRSDFIALYGKTVAVVLGNLSTADYEIVDLEACPIDEALHADYKRRGLGYVGTLGLIDERFQEAYAVPLPPDVIVGLASNYARLVLYKIANPKKPSGDGVEWLSRLYELPDTRQEN